MRARQTFNAPVFVTRRCLQRVFRLTPTKKTTQIVIYLLAVLSQKYGIDVYAACAMSNHWHGVLSGLMDDLPNFTRDFHSMTARHINAHYGDTEALWNGSQTSHVWLETPDDTLGKIAYTKGNVVAAGCVMYGHRWSGLCGAFGDAPITVKRPAGFLREIEDENGEDLWPPEATLTFARPPGFDNLDDDELAALIEEKVREAEAVARKEILDQGRKFIGMRAIRAQNRYARPRSREKRGRISPRVACKDKWRRIERIQANKQWLIDYKESLERYDAGDRDVEFPYGTYLMRVRHNVNVAAAPS